MLRYLASRLVYLVLVMIGVSMLVFGLSRLSGDPRYLYMTQGSHYSQEAWDARGRDLGLDKPFVIQYLTWAGRAATGDFGDSVWHKRNSLDLIIERAPATLQLSGVAYLFAILIGTGLGIASAVMRGSIIDLLIRGFALTGQAAPPFLVAIILIFVFAVNMHLFPTSRRGDWSSFVLPVATLAWLGSASLTRITRSSMLEVLDSEYIKLARAKGVGRTSIIFKHALKNALVAPLTLSAILFASFITGTVVVETVFAWPGIGRLALEATLHNDFPLVTGLTVFFSAIYLVSSLVSDLIYAYIDPRVRLY